ncbi:MAG: hypothetical protein A2Z83_01085 [Omnitrophica bacterium GWA2_52_8]|nr:MAG: hypothetical protein A2Z83_01085 [Omnitrophica bacterium GWA2_52_8]
MFGQIGAVEDFDAFFDELYRVFGEPDAWRLYPETMEVLRSLKKAGKKMAVISNWDSRLFRLMKGLAIEEYFEFVLASAVFGASKPNPKIFEAALEKMGAKPAHAVHIGDSLEDDIKGAGRAGIWGIWIDRHGRKGSMPVPHPFNHVPAIGHLGELI